MLYEINLCCPVCGNYEFYQEEEGISICSECEWRGTTVEMNTQTFEI